MIPPDHDRRFHLSSCNKLVKDGAHLRPLTVSQPADPGGQSLELDQPLRLVDPTAELLILREGFLHRAVCPVKVLRLTGKHCPAERPLPLAKQGTDVLGNEARDVEGVFQPVPESVPPDVIAVIEYDRSALPA